MTAYVVVVDVLFPSTEFIAIAIDRYSIPDALPRRVDEPRGLVLSMAKSTRQGGHPLAHFEAKLAYLDLLFVFGLKTILCLCSLEVGGKPVHVISKKRLVAAGERHPEALAPLMRWYRVARKALWKDIHETRADFPHADPVGKFTVFNIKKNEYRLITVIHYNRFKIYIRAVLTHGEYDKGKWKDD